MSRLVKILFISLMGIALIAGFGLPAAAVTLSFDPCDASILTGDSIDIDVVISGLGNDELSAFSFDVNYDNTVLEFQSYTLGSGLGVVGEMTDPNAGAWDWSGGDSVPGGSINLYELSLLWDLSFQGDSFTLATLSFDGLAEGNSPLSFTGNIYLGDYWGDPLSADFDICSVDVSAAPVPEPATMILLATGLLGLAGVRKKFKK